MNPVEACIPPGFRFHPTEEELVGYYLKKKINSQKIDLDVIIDIDLYRMEPWQIQEKCSKLGNEEENEWYFFSYKDRKYPCGTRTNRATSTGFWKATGRDKAVLSNDNIIGMRKTLVFYNGRAPNGRKTDWIMHEYRLQTNDLAPPQEEGWVVCRAFKKPIPCYNNWNNNHYNNYYPITNTKTNNSNTTYNNNIRNTNLTMVDDSPSFVQLQASNSPSLQAGSGTSNTGLQPRHVSQEFTFINSISVIDHIMDLPELGSPSISTSLVAKNGWSDQQMSTTCGGLIGNVVDSFLGSNQVDEITATTISLFSDQAPNLEVQHGGEYDEFEAHNMAYFLGDYPNL